MSSKLSRRAAMTGLGSAAFLGCAQAQTTPTRTTSGLRIKTTDYAVDRQAFQTRLLRRTPSPQPYGVDRVPSGVREIHYPSGDLRLKAWFARPASAPEQAPLVVFAHGGFAFGAEDLDMARPYLAAGYAVAVPWVRGENGLPGAFSMFYDEAADIIAVTEFLKTQAGIDSERIYLAGHSVGGTLAMLAGQASSNYRAVASFSGSPDQLLFCREYAQITPFDLNDLAESEMRSPLSYAASFKAPARLFYAQGEVYGEDTQLMARIAKAAGLDVEALAVRGDHFTAVPEAMRQSIEFFRLHS
ncbi:MAG TPA: alpha/beta fold hydrolase [Vitreimonas sp.]|uniref:alpha/beta hydrolase family protein n=1 Tax=Vitreimonas sp. TaxID=3069702 RepID=UPI002D5700F5|nr:alpha/beta fold hydrolase [Vitreimonas sp.]HYD87980.1 alpha/beta fold hydrolase [Vitreimonas sp.]